MWKLVALSVSQGLMISLGQLTLKIALTKMPPFAWTLTFLKGALTNWWFMLCGILFGASSLLWMYILKHFPLSIAYPMASISYVFTILFAVWILGETVHWERYLGVALIILGCIFVVK